MIIWFVGLILTIMAAIISSNTRWDRHQNTTDEQTLAGMAQSLSKVNMELYMAYSGIEYLESEKTRLQSDMCSWFIASWLPCDFWEWVTDVVDYQSEWYPTGALWKDMNGEPVATKYIPWGKPIPNIAGNTVSKRFTNFVRYYANWFDESVFVEARNVYGIKEEILACAAWSETSLGSENKTAGNILNYGNTDWGKTRSYDTIHSNVMAAAHWLAQGRYMWGNNILGELSNWGRTELGLPNCNEATAPNKCYATSEVNRHRNMSNCLTYLYGDKQEWAHYAIKSGVLAFN